MSDDDTPKVVKLGAPTQEEKEKTLHELYGQALGDWQVVAPGSVDLNIPHGLKYEDRLGTFYYFRCYDDSPDDVRLFFVEAADDSFYFEKLYNTLHKAKMYLQWKIIRRIRALTYIWNESDKFSQVYREMVDLYERRIREELTQDAVSCTARSERTPPPDP